MVFSLMLRATSLLESHGPNLNQPRRGCLPVDSIHVSGRIPESRENISSNVFRNCIHISNKWCATPFLQNWPFLHPPPDVLVRVVTLKKENNTPKRNITNLHHLYRLTHCWPFNVIVGGGIKSLQQYCFIHTHNALSFSQPRFYLPTL